MIWILLRCRQAPLFPPQEDIEKVVREDAVRAVEDGTSSLGWVICHQPTGRVADHSTGKWGPSEPPRRHPRVDPSIYHMMLAWYPIRKEVNWPDCTDRQAYFIEKHLQSEGEDTARYRPHYVTSSESWMLIGQLRRVITQHLFLDQAELTCMKEIPQQCPSIGGDLSLLSLLMRSDKIGMHIYKRDKWLRLFNPTFKLKFALIFHSFIQLFIHPSIHPSVCPTLLPYRVSKRLRHIYPIK